LLPLQHNLYRYRIGFLFQDILRANYAIGDSDCRALLLQYRGLSINSYQYSSIASLHGVPIYYDGHGCSISVSCRCGGSGISAIGNGESHALQLQGLFLDYMQFVEG